MKKDRENQRRSTSNVAVRFFLRETHQPTHEFHCRTSSGCRCFEVRTLAGMPASTRYRVGHGFRLPMRKKINVEEKT